MVSAKVELHVHYCVQVWAVAAARCLGNREETSLIHSRTNYTFLSKSHPGNIRATSSTYERISFQLSARSRQSQTHRAV